MSRRHADMSRPVHHTSTGEAISVGFAMLLGVLVVIIAAVFFLSFPWHAAHAHESWINRGAFKNTAGEWCCGDHDCRTYPDPDRKITVEKNPKGWVIQHEDPAQYEYVPYDEALPVAPPDGQLTICRRPDGTRRCVFGIKPGL